MKLRLEWLLRSPPDELDLVQSAAERRELVERVLRGAFTRKPGRDDERVWIVEGASGLLGELP
jgi:hypothetical protein